MIGITGGTGVMGRALVARFRDAGESVRVFCLPGDPGIERVRALGAEIVEGDVSRGDDVSGFCRGVDTLFHLAAVIIAFDNRVYERVNIGGTRNVLADAVREQVRHVIHVSSASVVYPRTTAYSRSKRACEALVVESGLPYTIVRPTLVYDQSGGEEFNAFLDYLAAFPVVPFIGRGAAIKRPVHVEDLIEGFVRLANSPEALYTVLNFSGAEPISMHAFAGLCLKLQGTPRKPIVSVPVWLCSMLSSVLKPFMKRPPLRWPVIAGVTQDADLDPTEAMQSIGYAPSRVTERLPACFPRKPTLSPKG